MEQKLQQLIYKFFNEMKHIKTNNFLHGCGFEMSDVKYLYIMKAKNTLSVANQLVCKWSLKAKGNGKGSRSSVLLI